MTRGNTWINALIGAAITLGLSFTGFSPLLGGGVAGYLQHETARSGAKVGALSGALAMIPLFFIMIAGFMFFIPVAGAGVPGGIELIIIFFFIMPMMTVWFVGLSAAGGYLGGYLYSERETTVDDTTAVTK